MIFYLQLGLPRTFKWLGTTHQCSTLYELISDTMDTFYELNSKIIYFRRQMFMYWKFNLPAPNPSFTIQFFWTHKSNQFVGVTGNYHALMCIAENSVGPLSTRPDDVHTFLSGKTVEVSLHLFFAISIANCEEKKQTKATSFRIVVHGEKSVNISS